ncbi:MAG TPA: NADP-dependent oxidoreductase [Baekduia sp.]|nr:NADP-dependent oxidoreductase [Baekduia sp.]
MSDALPEVTTAIVATAYGGPEVLEAVQRPLDPPGRGQALLEVRAAGVNPIDWKLYSGLRGKDPDALPLPVGFEAAGVVLAVGAGAEGPAGPISVGDEVIAYPISGAYAKHVIVDGSALVPKPETLTFAEAGGLMLAGTTAIHALTATAVGPGDTLLLHGGSGGVGLLTIQLAVARGAKVVATASEPRHEALRALGATPITYGDGLLERVRATAPDGVTAAIDAVGTDEAIETSLELVADRDRIGTIVRHSEADLGIRRLGNSPGADPGTELRAAARLELVEFSTREKLDLPTTTRPLDQAADAHRESIAGHTFGKVVLTP